MPTSAWCAGTPQKREPGSAGFGQRLPFESNGGAAAGDVLHGAALGTAVGDCRFRRCELGVRLDVDLPAGQPGGEAGVHAFLADREGELVVGDDDRRLLRVVVEVHLADAGRRERLRDEPGRLVVPRDDVDLLAAKLGDDHADARAARADAGADGIDALSVRLDRDLRAIAGLPGDAADLTRLSAISGTSSSNSVLISSGSRRDRITCGPFVPERTSVITALIREPCS